MVAVIKVSRSIHSVMNYNESKVKAGAAVCIGAENFPLDADEMSLKTKLGYFLKRFQLNENVQRNSLHISLNFDPSEKNLTPEKLMNIARTYMEKIGFGDQPFVAYQHHDAGHPHIHLVSTNIQADGKRIDLHHLGIRKSEPARKEIERAFNLVAADTRARKRAFQLGPIDAQRVQYGRTETKRAITNVLDAVITSYNYTSLPELNAILNLYNVMADRGGEQSRIFQHGGLVYRVLDGRGKPIGIPIKASAFYNKPTLKFLEKQFRRNGTKRQAFKSTIKTEIDRQFIGRAPTLPQFLERLDKKGIHVVLRVNEAGTIYGITYIDHRTKSVFNGSDLGKSYSAKAIQERCGTSVDVQPPFQLEQPKEGNDLLSILLQPQQQSDFLPWQLKRKARKKKKRAWNSSNH